MRNLKKECMKPICFYQNTDLLPLPGEMYRIDREKGLVVIKPSGVEYDKLKPEDMVVIDLDGKGQRGSLIPPPIPKLTLSCTRLSTI